MTHSPSSEGEISSTFSSHCQLLPACLLCSPCRARESTKVKSNNSRDRLRARVTRPSTLPRGTHFLFSFVLLLFSSRDQTLAGTVAALGTAASEDMPHFASHLTFVHARAPWTMNPLAGYPLWISPR